MKVGSVQGKIQSLNHELIDVCSRARAYVFPLPSSLLPLFLLYSLIGRCSGCHCARRCDRRRAHRHSRCCGNAVAVSIAFFVSLTANDSFGLPFWGLPFVLVAVI